MARKAERSSSFTVPVDFSVLPAPDQFGNYWFGKSGAGDSCAIFPVKGECKSLGKYFVSLGERGILFYTGGDSLTPARFQTFNSPIEALQAIRANLGVR